MKVEVRTYVYPPHVIRQVVHEIGQGGCLEDAVEYFHSIVVDTKEKQFRAALIELGWTPPKEG